MVKQIVGEGARVLHTQCFPSQFGCTDEGAPRYAYDPAKAKALLAEAGLPTASTLDLYAYRERNQTEAMIGYLRAVGIRPTCASCNTRRCAMQCVRARPALVHQTWGSFSVNDVSASTPVYWKFQPDDITRDAEVRDLLEQGDSSVDPAVRKEAYAQGAEDHRRACLLAAALFAADLLRRQPRTSISLPIRTRCPASGR